jgi:putative membrane protein
MNDVPRNEENAAVVAIVETDPRVYLAVERTFLAWIRTGLAMMGFGFVVARFGVFLREIAAVHPINPENSPRMSLWFGTALVIVGAIVNLAAAVHHVRVVRGLRVGAANFTQPSGVGISVALLLAAIGAAMIGYLVLLV